MRQPYHPKDSALKIVLVGSFLAILLLGIGGAATVVGIDATRNGWASTGGDYRRFSRDRGRKKMRDKTRLYGPGLVVGGISTGLAGLLVIPSFLMMNAGKTHRLWPKVVLCWKAIRFGIAVGFGLAVLGSVVNVVM